MIRFNFLDIILSRHLRQRPRRDFDVVPAALLNCQVKNRRSLIGRSASTTCLEVTVAHAEPLEVGPDATRQLRVAGHLNRLNERLRSLGPFRYIAGRFPVENLYRIGRHRAAGALGRDVVVAPMDEVCSTDEGDLVISRTDRERGVGTQHLQVDGHGYAAREELVTHAHRISVNNRGRAEVPLNNEVRTRLRNEVSPRPRDWTERVAPRGEILLDLQMQVRAFDLRLGRWLWFLEDAPEEPAPVTASVLIGRERL